MTLEKEFGLQPLDVVMIKWKLTNNDLVNASTQQLTHKMVAKGRKGRRLTMNVQNKILAALNTLRPEASLSHRDLFNY